MKTALEVVQDFLRLTNDEGNIPGATQLLAEDVRFTGPAITITGAKEYAGLLEQFLSAHVSWRKYQEFQNGDEVCVIDDIQVKTPVGSMITLSLAEWFKTANGKITEHKVFYDPREFVKAFGM